MKAKVRHVGNVAVVDLSGKIMIGGGDVLLRDTVNELLVNGKRHILLNLQRVAHMDSAGIGELVACYKEACKEGATMKVLRPSEKVSVLLQITRFEELFEIYQDEQEALASF